MTVPFLNPIKFLMLKPVYPTARPSPCERLRAGRNSTWTCAPSSLPTAETLPSALSSAWTAAGSSLAVRLFLRRNRPTKSPRLLCSRRPVAAPTPAESAQALPRLPVRTRPSLILHTLRPGRVPAKGSGPAETCTRQSYARRTGL